MNVKIREIAYSIVKKMKANYTLDGCKWQEMIENELAGIDEDKDKEVKRSKK